MTSALPLYCQTYRMQFLLFQVWVDQANISKAELIHIFKT